MYSDVIFGWVVWIWLNSWHFVSDSLIFFWQSLEDLPGGTPGRRCRRSGRRRRFAPPPASAAATAARRASRQIFKRLPKKIKLSEKSANYQPNPHYQPKKRHYLYNSAVLCQNRQKTSRKKVIFYVFMWYSTFFLADYKAQFDFTNKNVKYHKKKSISLHIFDVFLAQIYDTREPFFFKKRPKSGS